MQVWESAKDNDLGRQGTRRLSCFEEVLGKNSFVGLAAVVPGAQCGSVQLRELLVEFHDKGEEAGLHCS
jgi:hypothetical protein